jgi:hypothetical protein
MLIAFRRDPRRAFAQMVTRRLFSDHTPGPPAVLYPRTDASCPALVVDQIQTVNPLRFISKTMSPLCEAKQIHSSCTSRLKPGPPALRRPSSGVQQLSSFSHPTSFRIPSTRTLAQRVRKPRTHPDQAFGVLW